MYECCDSSQSPILLQSMSSTLTVGVLSKWKCASLMDSPWFP